MHPSSEKAALLARHEFFRDMPVSAIQRMTAHARVVTVAKGTRIFAKGDEGHGLMAVLSGLVRISVPSDGETELMLNLIGAGEVFGEISLLDGEPRTAHATAMAPCRLLLLERRDFLATLMEEPVAAITLLRIVSRRLRRTSLQLEQASFGPMSSRLAQALLSLDGLASPAGILGGRIRMPQRQIGNMIGLSRESTNRHLRAWQRRGLIALEPGGLVVRDRRALAALADGDGAPGGQPAASDP